MILIFLDSAQFRIYIELPHRQQSEIETPFHTRYLFEMSPCTAALLF